METEKRIRIRTAKKEDADKLLEIYKPYVEKTAITFEYDVPSKEEFEKRIETTLKKYPYIVLEENETLVGYAYAGVFHAREAYDWAVETSIYVSNEKHGFGYGRLLHDALEEQLKKQGMLNMYACIACPKVDDEYLTHNSIEFHTHLGYRLVGTFYECGYKFSRWYHMVWMEKHIGEHKKATPVTWYSDL